MNDRERTPNRTESGPVDELAGLLRAADPVVAESEREERALARIAARLDGARAEPARSPWRFALPMLVAASVVAVAWIVPGQLRTPEQGAAREESNRVSVETPSNGSPTTAVETGAAARQIQFVTAGGTRVIWVLDPAFAF